MESVISGLKDREINGELELEILNSIQYFSQNTSGLDVNDVSNNNGMDTSGQEIGRTYDVMAGTSQGRSFVISSSLASSVSSPLSPTFYEKRTLINQDTNKNANYNDEKDNDNNEEKGRDDHTLMQNFNKSKTQTGNCNEDINDENKNCNGNSSLSGYGLDADCFDLTSALNGFSKLNSEDIMERMGEKEGGKMRESVGERERVGEGQRERKVERMRGSVGERERVGEGQRERKVERMRESVGERERVGEGQREREGNKNINTVSIENRVDSSTMIHENRMFSVSRNILPSNVRVIHTHDARTAYLSSGSTYTTQSDLNLDKIIEGNNDDCENEQNSTANKLNLKLKLSGFSSPSSSDETSIGKFSPSRFSDFSSDLECLSKKLDALSHINISGLRTSNS
jgi:hypothetical protein